MSTSPEKRRRALRKAIFCSLIGVSREPTFKRYDKLPEEIREQLKYLKSDDIKDDNFMSYYNQSSKIE